MAGADGAREDEGASASTNRCGVPERGLLKGRTMVKLTGLWKNAGKDGKTYLSGTVNPGVKLLVMPPKAG